MRNKSTTKGILKLGEYTFLSYGNDWIVSWDDGWIEIDLPLLRKKARETNMNLWCRASDLNGIRIDKEIETLAAIYK